MTEGTLDNLVAELRRTSPLSRISEDAGRVVFLTLLSLGYDLVKTRQPGRRYIESAESERHIIQYVRDQSPLGALAWPEAAAVFNRVNQLGYLIEEPLKHPSGLKTTAPAITDVTRLGAGMQSLASADAAHRST